MKSLIFICLTFVLSAVCVMSSCEKEPAEPVVSLPILPDSEAIAPWKPAGDPNIYRGEALYDFIDGGAEIVHEYGFRQAISHSYENDAGKGINLEVYIMEDPASAYGLYTFRTGKNGHSVEIGDEAFLESYYMNVWKGSHVITLIGFDSDAETMAGLQSIARALADKVDEQGKRPSLVDFLIETGLRPNRITYLRGPLALFNRYAFDTNDIFGVEEGVAGDYDTHRAFILAYESESEGRSRFQTAVTHLQKNPKYADARIEGNIFHIRDARGINLNIESFDRFILIVMGEDPVEVPDQRVKQKQRILRLIEEEMKK